MGKGGREGRDKKLIKQINIWHMNIHSFFHNLNDVNDLTRISLFVRPINNQTQCKPEHAIYGTR